VDLMGSIAKLKEEMEEIDEKIYNKTFAGKSKDDLFEIIADKSTTPKYRDIAMKLYDNWEKNLEKKTEIKHITKEEGIKNIDVEIRKKDIVSQLKSSDLLLKEGIPEVKWRVDKLIPEGSITIFGAPPGSFKTTSALYCGLCVAEGRTFFDNYTTIKGNVLYIDEESGHIQLLNKLGRLYSFLEIPPSKNFYHLVLSNIKLDREQGEIDTEVLKDIISENDIKLIIIDSFVRVLSGAEDKSDDVKKVFENIKDIQNQLFLNMKMIKEYQK